MKGIGIASFLIVTAVTVFYTTIIAHAVFYLFSSFREVMPWSLCSHSWNTNLCSERMRNKYINNQTDSDERINQTKTSPAEEYYNIYMLGINDSKGLTDLGYIKTDLFLCLISIFILMYICIYRGVKSTGKAVYVTAVLPYVVLIILLFQGVSLEGSYEGITYFLKPTFKKLREIKVWYSAANQIFFTLGPGLSVLTTYGSYNISTNNCYYDALIAVVANFAASFLAGFVVFSALGHMSWRLKKNIETVVGQGSSLSFIAYPEILATFKYPTFFSILFFLMVINLGLDSDFGGLEAMYTALSDEFTLLKRHRKSGMFIMFCLLIIICLPTVTHGKLILDLNIYFCFC
jgi:solute carrier family 6 serotonin transporter-like protein 4